VVSASALIIGDEILSGKIQDENSLVLARTLFEQGVRLTRIEVIPDDIDKIASCVRQMSKESDFVFTSGGIGPTHDDKTYEALAKAFGLKMSYHPETLRGFVEYQTLYAPDKPLNEARKKMAFLPEPCEIIHTEGLWVPLVVLGNVYILPGVPSLFARMLEGVKHRFKGPAIERVLIYTQKSEGDIAAELEAVQNAFPQVAIGSYPKYGLPEYMVMLSLEGTDKEAVHEAARLVEAAVEGYRKL
jgi:molybdenum cofactor synthesis domain-containing protein